MQWQLCLPLRSPTPTSPPAPTPLPILYGSSSHATSAPPAPLRSARTSLQQPQRCAPQAV
eukprot:365987-Chlamydomonas_euryale.AAC.6